jgi:hypothetical protein
MGKDLMAPPVFLGLILLVERGLAVQTVNVLMAQDLE